MKILLSNIRGALAALTLLFAACAAAQTSDADTLNRLFASSPLQIATSDARLHAFHMWIADNEPRRARGLMFVKHMDDNAGMLFIYPESQPISMWMKNTYIPLDMLFVSAEGRVVKIVENTTPQSLDTIDSGQPVRAVIELNAGAAGRLHLRPGSLVIHPAFPAR